MEDREYLSQSDEAAREGTVFPAEPPAVPPAGEEAVEAQGEGAEGDEGFGEAVTRPRLRPTDEPSPGEAPG